MVNIDTLLFLDTMNRIADNCKGGYMPFSEFVERYGPGAVPADDDNYDDCLVIYDDSEEGMNRVICDMQVNEQHADIISYYEADGVEGFYVVDDLSDEEPYVRVLFTEECLEGQGFTPMDDFEIDIDSTGWRFC